jgi:hypothetical protein
VVGTQRKLSEGVYGGSFRRHQGTAVSGVQSAMSADVATLDFGDHSLKENSFSVT